MAEYNFQPNLLGSSAGDEPSAFESAPFDFAPFELTPFASVMGQSADWITPGCPPPSTGGGTAAQPLPELDSAPFVDAGSGQ